MQNYGLRWFCETGRVFKDICNLIEKNKGFLCKIVINYFRAIIYN